MMAGEELDSPVLEFYKDAKVFITGGTGFLGKALVDKLLRVCTKVDRIYMLVREKKEKDPQTRLKELFDDPLFKTLRKEQPDFEKKVTCISGDIGSPKLNMDENTYEMLAKEVTHVIHSAATVRFNEKLKSAIEINVLGTQEILRFAQKCGKLKVLVHVSTAYAFCTSKFIHEEFYESPISGENALMLTKILDEDKLDALTPEIISPWPNTYSYTKAVAENVVEKHGKDLPVVIFRPAIVMGTYKEPLKGWTDNFYGPTGVIAGVGVGVLRVFQADETAPANLVPVDLTVNAILCAAWEVGSSYNNNEMIERPLEASMESAQFKPGTETLPKIYNFVPFEENSVTWGDFLKINLSYGMQFPTVKAIWYYSITLTRSKLLYYFLTLLFHCLPGIIMDGATFLLGKKPRMRKAYQKIHSFTEMTSTFGLNRWRFGDKNMRILWARLSETDKNLFHCNMMDVVWPSYFQDILNGIRMFIFNETEEMLQTAKRRIYILWLIHRTFQICFAAFCFWILSKLFFTFTYYLQTPLEESVMMESKLMNCSS